MFYYLVTFAILIAKSYNLIDDTIKSIATYDFIEK